MVRIEKQIKANFLKHIGYSNDEICQYLNISINQLWAYIRDKSNKRRIRKRKIDVDLIIPLWKRNFNHQQIANKLGYSRTSVYLELKKYDLV